MAPDDLRPHLNALIDQSDLLGGKFSVEAALLLASTMVRNPKVGNVLAWSSLGLSVGSKLWGQYKQHQKEQQRDYVLKINVDDPIFDTISRWVLQDTPEVEQYIVEATRVYRASNKTEEDPNDTVALLTRIFSGEEVDRVTAYNNAPGDYQNLALEVDDKRPMTLLVDGHELSVSFIMPGQLIDPEKEESSSDYPAAPSERYRGEPHYLVTCPSLEARKALLAKIDVSFKSDEKRLPSVYRSSPWGEMERVGDVPPRKLDTVILKEGQIESLIEDIAKFLHNEDYYNELGIPYHHGVLLYGPPGTGKTSIAAAAATALNLDVYAIQLSGIRDDASLGATFRSVRPRSVLLLEDIDTCRAARSDNEEQDEGKGVTIDGLLQALDGFSSPHGLITIMTTNNPGSLDERMVRDGRIDMRMEISCVDTSQVARLCSRFLGYVPEDLPEITVDDRISPAAVVGVFKAWMYDREGAGPALVARLDALLQAPKEDRPTLDTLMRLTKPVLQKMAEDSGIHFSTKTPKKALAAELLDK